MKVDKNVDMLIHFASNHYCAFTAASFMSSSECFKDFIALCFGSQAANSKDLSDPEICGYIYTTQL